MAHVIGQAANPPRLRRALSLMVGHLYRNYRSIKAGYRAYMRAWRRSHVSGVFLPTMPSLFGFSPTGEANGEPASSGSVGVQ